jgi:hypothetical protein
VRSFGEMRSDLAGLQQRHASQSAQLERALAATGATKPEIRSRLRQFEAEAAREWCERLQRAHAGDGAYSILRTLLADLPRLRTPWEQALRTQLAHGHSSFNINRLCFNIIIKL